jgi:hypothetical protein
MRESGAPSPSGTVKEQESLFRRNSAVGTEDRHVHTSNGTEARRRRPAATVSIARHLSLEHDKGKNPRLRSAPLPPRRIIPYRGSWLDFSEFDPRGHPLRSHPYARRKIPANGIGSRRLAIRSRTCSIISSIQSEPRLPLEGSEATQERRSRVAPLPALPSRISGTPRRGTSSSRPARQFNRVNRQRRSSPSQNQGIPIEDEELIGHAIAGHDIVDKSTGEVCPPRWARP